LGISTIKVSHVTTETLKIGSTMLMAAAIGTTLAGDALAQDKPGDWPSYNRMLSGERYAPQAAVTPATARQLHQVCSYDLGRQTSFQTGPVVIEDVIFVTTDFDTIAIDGATCAEKWRTTETYTAAGPLKVNRGAAVADGRVFRGTQDGRVLAYDASSGKRIWEVRIANPALGETVPAALIAWQGLVFAGNAGGDNKGGKGRMYALNATTGEVVWEQYLVPRQSGDQSYGPHAPAPAMPSVGWGNAADVPITGGATWTSYSLDSASGTLYVPAGNPAPDFARELRPGVNPYAGTLIALDAKTGAVRMTYPLVQRDYHDWDVSAAPAVFTTRGGVKIAAEAIKNGHVYGIDTVTGRHLWSVPTTTIENVQAPLSTNSSTRFCPGAQGGTEWNGASYSPQTNLVYVGAVDWCTTVKLASDDAIKAGKSGQPWGGADGKEPFGEFDPPARWAGWITAIDADLGKVVWKRKLPAPVLGGVTPTAGGVVFAADMLGNVYAFDALTGATVWHTQASGAVGGGIVSYATPSGAQRIAVAAGMTSPIWPTAKVNAEIVVYGLK
jgi:alcohol dehydrogenase (cytochrome c)